MWRRVARGLIFASLISLLVPGLFAQNFVGFLEKPAEGETVSGMVLVRGWALDEQQIAQVDLYVDGVFQYSADINLPRIDIIESFPNWTGVQTRQPGFQTGFLASRYSNGTHSVSLQVTTSDNRTFTLGPSTVTVDNTINQAPFGAVDIPDTSAIFDAHGSFPVNGWAADTDGVKRVDIIIDDYDYQSAMYGDPRPDVGNAFPDLPAAQFSGFVANVDTTRIPDGTHVLNVRVTDNLGLSRVIGRRNIQVFNTENNLPPFGYLDEPRKDAVLRGTRCAEIPPVSPPVRPDEFITPVRGWALDLGTRADLGRVSYAELMIDGVIWASTDQCTYVRDFDAYINCYGLPRFDVERYYPTYPDAPRAGFMFGLDVGGMLALGLHPGRHVLKIRVGDQEQTFAEIPNTSGIPVFFQCDEQVATAFGFIDYPQQMDFLKGTVTFNGWALSVPGVSAIEIYVDGNLMGVAQYGLVRTDVHEQYPMFRNSTYSGWRFTIDTNQISDARHRLTVQVVDSRGNKTIIGSTDFYVDNPRP